MQSLSRKHYTRPYMEIRKSSLPDAGYGVFATDYISANTVMEEYKGKRVSVGENKDSAYLFAIPDHLGKIQYMIDAEDVKKSNWTRFVNGAKTRVQRKKINVEFVPGIGGKVYLQALQDISPGEEMICDYGSAYWKKSPVP